VKIDIDDDGTVKIAAVNADSARAAISIIEGITQSAEVERSTREGCARSWISAPSWKSSLAPTACSTFPRSRSTG